jgi:hypothetical protein
MNPTAPILFTILLLTSCAGLAQTTSPAKPSFTLADLKAQLPQDQDGAFLMELSDILNTATDSAVRSLLQGQPVVTTAQVAIDPKSKPDPGRVTLVRNQIQCCAAHLRKCTVVAERPEQAAVFKDQVWVRVAGTLSYRQEGGKFTPFIVVREIKKIPLPADPLIR